MRSNRFEFVCFGCGGTGVLSEPLACPVCGEPRALRPITLPDPALMESPPASLWHYAPLLPVFSEANRATMGEGATPLVSARRWTSALGLGDLRFKNEMANPTGSFKDRQIAVGLSHALELGRSTVAVVSSGNVAAATAAYAARYGLRAVLFMHGQAGAGKIAQAAAYGAQVVRVDHPSPSAVFELCLEACARFGWYHLSTSGMHEAYNVEGAKTIAYELFQQYGGVLPDWIIAPVGGGGLLGGIWRGLLDLQRMGCIAALPKLAGVQAAGCAPLQQAIEENLPFLETLKRPWPNPKTVAGGIADDILFDGHTVLPALRTTGGIALKVDDPEIEAAQQRLAEEEGLLCELTTAVVPAALPQLARQAAGARVCAVLTGSGIKDLAYLSAKTVLPAPIPPSLDALATMLNAD